MNFAWSILRVLEKEGLSKRRFIMERQKVTIRQLQEMKARKEMITMLSAYDYPLGQAMDRAGVDIVCVGDSLGWSFWI
jgi:hypothetical protein